MTETPTQRFERLKAEVSQFLQEVTENKAANPPEDGDALDLKDIATELQVLHSHLVSVQGDVSQVLSSEDLTAIGASRLASARATDGSFSKHLASQLKSISAAKTAPSKDTVRALALLPVACS